MTYRRERNIREIYEERFLQERPGPYPRAAGAGERRGPFGRPEDDYGRGGYEYDGGPRFFPNGGGPRSYHGEDQRGYHGDNLHFPAERRAVPPSRREDYPYRVPREDPHTGRPMEFGTRAPPPHSVRSQGIYPAPRSLPESGEDTLVQAILNLDRGEDHYRRKAAPFPPIRERSPVRREVARSPHSRSGSSVSSRGYSPDRTKNLPFPSQQGKSVDGPEGHAGISEHLWGALFSQQSGHDTLGQESNLSRHLILAVHDTLFLYQPLMQTKFLACQEMALHRAQPQTRRRPILQKERKRSQWRLLSWRKATSPQTTSRSVEPRPSQSKPGR
ncbi:periphilin-1 isoform X5 [Myripristis murdjan]|uniref:periphilin-1 isoform X5 n=1 Tax=Myripristis murdjan TaxID=586833 RepID=UPI001176362A|nr:uncharacterized protein LOC115354968 isoform X5 [Myripristis murdjan]